MKIVNALLMVMIICLFTTVVHAQPRGYGPPGPGPGPGPILAVPIFMMGMLFGGILATTPPPPPQIYYAPPPPMYPPAYPCPPGYMFVPPYPPYGARCVSR